MNAMFYAFKPALEAAGVTPAETWEATRTKLAVQARAQLSRPNLKPETTQKWHVLGYLAGAAKNN
jgi:hypothetical protein